LATWLTYLSARISRTDCERAEHGLLLEAWLCLT
jgi:hypothetical protein